MNSFHEQFPNSDCKQCTELKLGWVYSAHPQSLGRAHTARSAQVMGVAARAADRSRAQPAHVAHLLACVGRDTPRQPTPGRDLTSMSRHQGNQNHVATSNRCRDTVSPAQPQARSRHQNQVATLLETPLCRNINFMSRLRFPTSQVATSFLCRDLLETNLCRDINFMSRPRFCPQWDFQVATPNSRSRPPTLLPMSRPQLSSAPFLLRRDAIFSMSQPPLLPPMSRPQN